MREDYLASYESTAAAAASSSKANSSFWEHLERSLLERNRTRLLAFAWRSPSLLSYITLKRAIDVFLTILAAPFILMLISVLALCIRLDGGPAFFAQPRVGKGGRTFRLWKLRTMTPDAENALEAYLANNPAAEAEWRLLQKLSKDPRITPMGRYLRKYSLDELPQFFNVLTGDMSLVGPRPMFPEQQRDYPGIDYFSLRPGITGLWQVSARNRSSFAERAIHDTHYATIMSFWSDLRILLATVLVVCKGTGL